jgi:hypothetical protein
MTSPRFRKSRSTTSRAAAAILERFKARQSARSHFPTALPTIRDCCTASAASSIADLADVRTQQPVPISASADHVTVRFALGASSSSG